MVVGYQIPPRKKNPYWGWAFVCFCLGFFFVMMGSATDEDDPWMWLTCSTCLAFIIFSIMGISSASAGSHRTVIVQQPRPMMVQQPVVIQQTPVVHHAQHQVQRRVPQNLPPNKADQRKSTHLQRAHQLEMAGNLSEAITAYELAEDYREAQRVRTALTTQGNQNQGGVNINIGKVGDTNTNVTDGVYMSGSDDDQI